MSEPFVGEIRMFAGNFVPRGWAFCDGQLLAVAQNDVLFSLFGTIYGGDGRTTFGLPDLRGRLPVHAGSGPGLSPRKLGAKGGLETVTLTQAQMPAHEHPANALGTAGDSADPSGRIWAAVTAGTRYSTGASDTPMHASILAPMGGSRSHTNLQPFLCVNFIVSLFGINPSRN